MTSTFSGRLPLYPTVLVTADDGGSATTELDNQLARMRHLDARSFSYMFLYRVIFDDNNLLRMVGEKPTQAAKKIGRALEKYGMNTVQKLELRGDETGGKKMNLEGILRFLANSPSLREFSYISRHKTLPPLYLKALKLNNSFLQRLELHCLYFPLEALCEFLKETKTLSYLLLDGNVHMNHIYHVNHQQLRMFCLALSANQSLKELDFFVINFNNKNQKKRLITQEKNDTVKTVRFRNGKADAHSVYNLLHVLGGAEEIEWSLMGRNDKVLFESISSMETKRSLSLDFLSHTDRPPDPSIVQKFIEEQTGLKSLSLSYGGSPSLQRFLRSIGKTLEHHPSMKALKLANVVDDGLEYLAKAKLVKLDIWAWSLESNLPNLCRLLKQRHCKLKEMNLELHTLECFGDLCFALKQNRSLKSFALIATPTRPTHRQISEAGYDMLDRCLADFTMEKLSFSGSGIGPTFCRRFFLALYRQTNRFLTELEIDSNKPGLIDIESMALLCQYLQQPSCHLSKLLLKSEAQNIAPNSVEYLLATMSSFPTPIETLHVTCNVSDLKTISSYIPRIQTLKKLTFHVFNDFEDAWRGEKLKIDLLIAIGCRDSLQEFHCNLDEEGHFFQNRLFLFNQQKKIDRLLALPEDQQLPLGIWPHVMESMQKKAHCPSLLFYLLTVQANSIFSQTRPVEEASTAARQEDRQELLLEHDRAISSHAHSTTTAPFPSAEEAAMDSAYAGCGCLPAFFDWDWNWWNTDDGS